MINCIHVIQVTFQILYKSDIVISEQKKAHSNPFSILTYLATEQSK